MRGLALWDGRARGGGGMLAPGMALREQGYSVPGMQQTFGAVDEAGGVGVFDSHGPSLSWADLVMDHGCVVEGEHDHPTFVTDNTLPASRTN